MMEPERATEEDPNTVNDELAQMPTEQDGAASSVPDPREAATPGLPAGRSGGDTSRERTIVVDAPDPAVLAMAHRVVDLAADKKASDIVLLDVRGQTTMTDYFVICSGASDRQLNAIADGVIEGLKEDGDLLLSREGDAGSHWLLVDFGGVIVHVMSKPEREFYQLEKLWSEASLLVHVV
jgi:ribosome-associated protein